MTITPLLSVVIPAHGVAKTLGTTVASVHTATRESYEIIIVVDGDSDDSLLVAQQLASESALIRVVHLVVSGGPSRARNEGLAVATGDWVLFLDGDDRLELGALDILLRAVAAGDIGSLGRFNAVDENDAVLDIGTWSTFQLQPVIVRKGKLVPSALNPESVLTRLVTPPPGAILLRRSAIIELGGYSKNARRSEDLEFLVRVVGYGSVALTQVPVLRYLRTATQRSAQVRQRQWGRVATLIYVLRSAPSRKDRRERGRGVVNHYRLTAQSRWRESSRRPGDLVAVGRALVLAAVFSLLRVI
ncbi:MAG: glycosyltransferase family 2 protein [Actinomycetota bacterium]